MRNIRLRHVSGIAFSLAVVAALAVTACGGSDATATPPPVSTATAPRPTATPAPSPTSTPVPATATPVPTPTPFGGAAPTPVTLAGGKRGGVFQASTSVPYLASYDTYDSRGGITASVLRFPMLNSLSMEDPFSPGVIVPDAAQGFEYTGDGRVLTYKLRQGIQFHDGRPFTSKDVFYNLDRALNPPAPTQNQLKARLAALDRVETPDDYTVRMTLKKPSNYLLQGISSIQTLMYPAHFPLPQDSETFKKNPIGTGPFKFKNQESGTKLEYVRNDDYFKKGLPYLDAYTITAMAYETAYAAYRTSKLDGVTLDHSVVENNTDVLARETGFQKSLIFAGVYGPQININRKPYDDIRVREAISLVYDRQTLLATWLQGRGTSFASPLLPPELGGRWGISVEEMKNRPGFRADKTQDIARAKDLLKEAGVNPANVTISIEGTNLQPTFLEVLENNLRDLGFKTKLELIPTVDSNDRQRRADFDIHGAIMSAALDDPLDTVGPWAITGGASNNVKWTNPRLDAITDEQDATSDPVKRKALLREWQEVILNQYVIIPGVWRGSYHGAQPWVKGYPLKLPFTFSPKWRMEQVWLER